MTGNIDLFIQNSIRIRGEKVIYIDPFRIQSNYQDADFVLITHDHYDHFSPEDIRKVLKPETVIVAPVNMEAAVEAEFGKTSEIITVAPNKAYEVKGLSFQTVPAYNTGKSYHPKSAGWVGYVIETEDKVIYVAGDTDATAELKAVECDVAMVPIGGTFTMDPGEAAEAVNAMKPKAVIPTHYGAIVGSRADAQEFQRRLADGIAADIRM